MYKSRRLVIFANFYVLWIGPRVGSGRVQELVNFSGSGRVTPFPGQVGSGRKIWTRVQLWAVRWRAVGHWPKWTIYETPVTEMPPNPRYCSYTSCLSFPRIPPRFRAAAVRRPSLNFWFKKATAFHGGTTINGSHCKDVCLWRFGDNPSSRCWAVASKKERRQTQNAS